MIYGSLETETNLFVWRSLLDDLERCPLLSDDTDDALHSSLIDTMLDLVPKLKSSDMVFYLFCTNINRTSLFRILDAFNLIRFLFWKN